MPRRYSTLVDVDSGSVLDVTSTSAPVSLFSSTFAWLKYICTAVLWTALSIYMTACIAYIIGAVVMDIVATHNGATTGAGYKYQAPQVFGTIYSHTVDSFKGFFFYFFRTLIYSLRIFSAGVSSASGVASSIINATSEL